MGSKPGLTSAGNVFVSIPLPAPFLSFGVGYSCAVELSPRTRGDFSVVGDIHASLLVEYL